MLALADDSMEQIIHSTPAAPGGALLSRLFIQEEQMSSSGLGKCLPRGSPAPLLSKAAL